MYSRQILRGFIFRGVKWDMNLIKKQLSSDQEKKTNADLQLIDKLIKAVRNNGMRMIISGGYAVDGFFGEITRYHNDTDIQIYGTKENAEEVIERLLDSISPASGWEYTTEDKGRKEYYHNLVYKFRNSTLDIYYLQTKTSPLGKEKFIIKSDGTVDKQKFADPIFGKIGNISFEIQDPAWELKDKIYKREERGDPKRPEHEQDIENLKHAFETKGIVGI